MYAQFQEQVRLMALLAEIGHCVAHADGGRDGAVGGREGGHDRISDRLYDGASLRGDDLVQNPEMLLHQIEGD